MADQSNNRAHLRGIAYQAMHERGLEPDIPKDALAQADALKGPATTTEEPIRDLRQLLWCSIDNDDSRDLDRRRWPSSRRAATSVMVAIADVDASVAKDAGGRTPR